MRSSDRLRLRIAAEAARIISESGLQDRGRAVRKAAERLGVRDRAAWPDDAAILDALAEHQRLFRGEAHQEALQERRHAAIEAMRFFSGFHPRVHGAVLDGTADVHSPVRLHLHADDPESVDRFLIEHRVPASAGSRRIRTPGGGGLEVPVHRFRADDLEFELTVLPRACLRDAPLDRNGERAVERADLQGLQRLLPPR